MKPNKYSYIAKYIYLSFMAKLPKHYYYVSYADSGGIAHVATGVARGSKSWIISRTLQRLLRDLGAKNPVILSVIKITRREHKEITKHIKSLGRWRTIDPDGSVREQAYTDAPK